MTREDMINESDGNNLMPMALEHIIKATEGAAVRYTIVKSVEDAINLIASLSDSASESMGYKWRKDSDNKVQEIIKTLAENKSRELITFILKEISYASHLIDKLVQAMMEDTDYVSHYEFETSWTTAGGVQYGWHYCGLDCYFAYVGCKREGAITEQAEKKGMIKLPQYINRPAIENWSYEVERLYENVEEREDA